MKGIQCVAVKVSDGRRRRLAVRRLGDKRPERNRGKKQSQKLLALSAWKHAASIAFEDFLVDFEARG
jgi:hypothetical protein